MSIKKYWPSLATFIFLLAVWCYWQFVCPAILVFKEQTQMFLFNTDYLLERLAYPAGVARYIAEFLVQFYNNIPLGAFIISLVIVTTQWLLWTTIRSKVAQSARATAVGYCLTFIPALTLLASLGNENMNHTFPLAMLLTMVAVRCYSLFPRTPLRVLYVALAIPLLYWMAGPVFFVFVLYAALDEAHRRKYLLSAVENCYAVCIILGSILFVKAPAYRIFLGITYSLTVSELLPMQIVVPLAFLAVLVVPSLLTRFQNSKIIYANLVFVLLAVVAVPFGITQGRYEVLEYDYLMRLGKWDAIIHKAERKNPTSPLTVASLNLALAMTGQQHDRAGHFFQNGVQGAFPLFNSNYLFSLMSSEVYFNVGLVNTAQRLCFEAMETIPDNNKSARLMKRLAETNLINGQYEVARKYLKMLRQTAFYHNWAVRTEQLLYNEEAINQHALYGYMRRVRLNEDFIFSESEIDKIMGRLVMQSRENAVAQQYLLLIPMLEGNRQKYMDYRSFLNGVMRAESPADTLTNK